MRLSFDKTPRLVTSQRLVVNRKPLRVAKRRLSQDSGTLLRTSGRHPVFKEPKRVVSKTLS
jgi:hypothetical protein